MTANKLIRCDPQVYEKLRDKVRGFESMNNVLRKVLGMPPLVGKKPGPKPKVKGTNGKVEDENG